MAGRGDGRLAVRAVALKLLRHSLTLSRLRQEHMMSHTLNDELDKLKREFDDVAVRNRALQDSICVHIAGDNTSPLLQTVTVSREGRSCQ